jgi:hypothetical protein
MGELDLADPPALVDGWHFWAEDRTADAFQRWSRGEAERIRALHLCDGRQGQWALPELTAEERDRWERRFDGPTSDWPDTFWGEQSFESIAVSGPRVVTTPHCIGTLAAGLALYQVFEDEDAPATWVAVR